MLLVLLRFFKSVLKCPMTKTKNVRSADRAGDEKVENSNATPVMIRPIRPEDEPLMVKFHETLSEQSVYFRYFQALHVSRRVAHERLTRICFNDYDREIALAHVCGFC